ncbi:xylanase [Xanthomonas oryzae]|uniref:Xylanase n=1 Tax=Xanthomonas oryzae TaxID=347 RepID=A0AAP1EW93_9XANT|nr:xylanase [Xanthomonas oryzae]
MHLRAVMLGLLVAAGMAAPAYAAPLASKAAKFLGSAYGAQQAPGFAQHWNKLPRKMSANGAVWKRCATR